MLNLSKRNAGWASVKSETFTPRMHPYAIAISSDRVLIIGGYGTTNMSDLLLLNFDNQDVIVSKLRDAPFMFSTLEGN